MLDPRPLCMLVALALGATDAPRVAWVGESGAEVLAEPDNASFVTGMLGPGQKVVVRGETDGWLAIEPPEGSFDWIDRAAVEDLGVDRARVIVPAAAVRSGRDRVRLPGPPVQVVRLGGTVRLVDRPPLVVGQGRKSLTWLAIEPPAGDRRYIHAEGVESIPPSASDSEDDEGPGGQPLDSGQGRRRTRRAARAGRPAFRIDPEFPRIGPPISRSALPPDLTAELGLIEARHRTALLGPMEGWRLGPIRSDYQALLRRQTDSGLRAIIQSRLERADRQDAASRAARDLTEVLRQGRQRDAEFARLRAGLARASARDAAPFDASGLLQPSSRLVEGQTVHVLIGDDGSPAAYLLIPPSLNVAQVLSRRVGVRGDVHYDEDLHARLISVRDLEPLEKAP